MLLAGVSAARRDLRLRDSNPVTPSSSSFFILFFFSFYNAFAWPYAVDATIFYCAIARVGPLGAWVQVEGEEEAFRGVGCVGGAGARLETFANPNES